MKKVITVGVFAIFGVIALSSCKKSYTCDCVGTGSSTVYQKTAKGSDGDAAACTDAQDTVLGIPTEICVPA